MRIATRRTIKRCRLAAALAIAAFQPGFGDRLAAEPEVDANTGLIIAPGWEMVAAHCGACHSHALVTAQRGDAAFWRSTIRWMQQTQNLWQIPDAQEQALITYLETNYNETDWGRRPPLAQSLMPQAL